MQGVPLRTCPVEISATSAVSKQWIEDTSRDLGSKQIIHWNQWQLQSGYAAFCPLLHSRTWVRMSLSGKFFVQDLYLRSARSRGKILCRDGETSGQNLCERSLQEIPVQGSNSFWQDLFRRPPETSLYKISWQELCERPLHKISWQDLDEKFWHKTCKRDL